MQRDGKTDKILGGLCTLKDAHAMMLVVDDLMRACETSVLNVDAISIPWEQVAAQMPQAWTPAQCQRVWRYLAYEADVGSDGELLDDSDVDDFVELDGDEAAEEAGAPKRPRREGRESIKALRAEAAAMADSAGIDPQLPRHQVRRGEVEEVPASHLPLLHKVGVALWQAQLDRELLPPPPPGFAPAPNAVATTAAQHFVNLAFRAERCGASPFPDFQGHGDEQFLQWSKTQFVDCPDKDAYVLLEQVVRQKQMAPSRVPLPAAGKKRKGGK